MSVIARVFSACPALFSGKQSVNFQPYSKDCFPPKKGGEAVIKNIPRNSLSTFGGTADFVFRIPIWLWYILAIEIYSDKIEIKNNLPRYVLHRGSLLRKSLSDNVTIIKIRKLTCPIWFSNLIAQGQAYQESLLV